MNGVLSCPCRQTSTSGNDYWWWICWRHYNRFNWSRLELRNAQFNQLDRLADGYDKLVDNQNAQLNAYRNATDAVMQTILLTRERFGLFHKELAQIRADVPEFIWAGMKVKSYIERAAEAAQNIADVCEEKRMDTKAWCLQ